ncbi:MAG: type I DNA topoisomerase [Candidatus Atribacteria bacterium]|nr:MAG: type I DNA topoisomerase [Candidatus Atribacteria bacterium]
MPKGLIIVESPAKANTISKFLDHKFDVKASMGHIRDLPAKEMGIDIDKDFTPKYLVDTKKKKIIEALKEAMVKADSVYLASDHDREGEAIAWHLQQVLKKEIADKPVHRIVFNEITRTAIQSSISNPGAIDMQKVDAQQARRILDRFVGYMISPLLWKVISKDLSAGRVQSVALRLICEREAEIRSFVPKEYWRVETSFNKDKLPSFKGTLETWKAKKAEIENQEQAAKIIEAINGKEAKLLNRKDSVRSIEPYPAFITSTLQQDASRLLNIPANKTMQIAQELYEGVDLDGERTGLITYMRTDSLRVAEEANYACRNLIEERFGKDYVHKSIRHYKNKNNAQDAHEAIRPTDPFKTPEAVAKYLGKDQLRLYTLIWQRFIATQMNPLKLKQTDVKVGLGEAVFASSGSEVADDGFTKAWTYYSFSSGEKIDDAYKAEDALLYEPFVPSQHFTSPPNRFTEASLIKELEAKGIGRPSTYASIITTIRVRKYVAMEKKSFVPTELGIQVNRFLVDKFDIIFNVKFTAEMESKLDEVEYGKVVWHQLIRKYYDQLVKLIGLIDVKQEKKDLQEVTDIVCDVCKEGRMVIKWGKKKQYLSCNRFPDCKNIKSFSKDANGKIHIEEPELLEEKCPQCGSPLLLRKGRFGEFIACSTYPKCKYSRSISLGVVCPECGKGDVVRRSSKKGKSFYCCSTYPACKWISNDKPVPIVCVECGNPFLYEKYSKANGEYKLCPKCKKEYF